MARRATKDTIALEPVGIVPGDDSVVQRQVFAGDEVPDHWQFENSGDVEDFEPRRTGLGAAPHAYKSQLEEDGTVKEEHQTEHQKSKASGGSARGRKPAESSSGGSSKASS